MSNFDRRRFLRAAAAGGFIYAFGHVPNTVMAQMAGSYAPFNDYRALVCVFLFGGNDSWNMVVPRSDAEYAVYAASRQSLALDQTTLLPISPLTPDGAQYGFHPAMSGVQQLFETNRCAVIANAGPLIAPTTKAQYAAKSVPLPPQLFSHNDQQDQWHTLKGNAQSKTGWAGRMADVLSATTSGQQLPLNVSLSGQTIFQAGEQSVPYTMGPEGPVEFFGFAGDALADARRQGFENVVNASYDTVYERAYASVQHRALQVSDSVNAALAMAPTLSTTFPATNLGTQLRTVARTIAVRDRLQMNRQVFFVAAGGFDTHNDQVADQPGLLGGISDAMAAFHAATVELGISQSVTAFTQSDFGRTLTSNGDGTDHAWGGVQLVVGDAVRGRQFYGSYPLLEIGGAVDVGGGRLIPELSSDQYAATLARWFGVADTDLETIAPSLGNFATRDLGFLI
ncbi:MAG: DUF1501 domain-containing protein [Gammaproteobacteria bacterium]